MNYTPRFHQFPAVLAIGIAALASLPTVQATVLPAPTVTGSSGDFDATFKKENATDGTSAEFASSNKGINTSLTMSFGSPVTFDRVVTVTRNSAAATDRFQNYTLTFDSGSQSFSGTGQQAVGTIFSLSAPVTTAGVTFDVDTLSGGSTATTGNTGVLEMLYFQTPVGSQIVSGVSAIAASTPFSGFNFASSADGKVGFGALSEYASSGAGTSTFVTFDLGSLQSINGFDFIDRLSERASAFSLTFSSDTTFDGSDTVLPFTKGSALAYSGAFAPIDARYVRYNVTAGTGNLGVNEMIFYSVPEPGAWMSLLGGMGVLVGLRRRRMAV